MTILIVDDEPMILKHLRSALEDAGYSVLASDTGSQAVQQLGEFKAEIRALVTDIRLPGDMDGWAIARRARALGQMPIIYISGGRRS